MFAFVVFVSVFSQRRTWSHVNVCYMMSPIRLSVGL